MNWIDSLTQRFSIFLCRYYFICQFCKSLMKEKKEEWEILQWLKVLLVIKKQPCRSIFNTAKRSLLISTVKLANSASLFKFCQVKFPQKKMLKNWSWLLEDNKMWETKRNSMQFALFVKNTFHYSQDLLVVGILAELANFTV